MSVLEMRDVTAAYPRGADVLRAVSARFEPGVTVLLGPNGAGKSTLLRVLLNRLRPRAGSVLLAGRSLASIRPPRLARMIAYVPQRPELSVAFSVRQTVALGAHARGRDDDAVERALERVGVRERADEPFATLSVGQQQRVTLARALAQLDGPGDQPRFLLADEPFSAMDPRHVMQGAAILRELADSGGAVVVVLHDFTLARRLADRAVVLNEGGGLACSGRARETIVPDRLEPVFGVSFTECRAGAGVAVIPESPVGEAGRLGAI